MNATQLLTDLSERGLHVRADGEWLRIRPKSKLTPVLLAEVKAHKREILAHLRHQRCDRCRELQAEGVEPILCSICGYEAPAPRPEPTAEDLRYPLAYVRRQVPTLPRLYRERFDYWLDLMRGAGWTPEQAERGAFRRVLWSPPATARHGGSHRQLKLVRSGE